MATFFHATETTHRAARPALWAQVVNAVSNFYRAMKNRRAVYRLGEMSDAELADIGLTRSDLTVAIDLPFGSDPTTHLGAIAQSRVDQIDRIEETARRVA